MAVVPRRRPIAISIACGSREVALGHDHPKSKEDHGIFIPCFHKELHLHSSCSRTTCHHMLIQAVFKCKPTKPWRPLSPAHARWTLPPIMAMPSRTGTVPQGRTRAGREAGQTRIRTEASPGRRPCSRDPDPKTRCRWVQICHDPNSYGRVATYCHIKQRWSLVPGGYARCVARRLRDAAPRAV